MNIKVNTVSPSAAAVIVVIDRNETNAKGGKNLFQKRPQFNIIPCKPGKVFDNNTIYPSRFCHTKHPLHPRAFQVRSCIPIIAKFEQFIILKIFRCVFLQKGSLHSDAVAFSLSSLIFLRQTHVNCNPNLFH